MNLYLVSAAHWGTEFNLVEAVSEEEAIRIAYPHGTGFRHPTAERIDLTGTPGIRWSYEYSPDSPRDD